MKESLKKLFNLTAFKEFKEAGEPAEEDVDTLAYLEYKKRKDRKNDINFRSTGGVTRQRANDKQNIGDMFGVHSNSTLRIEKKSPHFTSRNGEQSTTFIYKYNKYSDKKPRSNGILTLLTYLTDMLNELKTLNFLNYINRNVKINFRKHDKDEHGEEELNLNPPAQPGDLIHKESSIYALILPGWNWIGQWIFDQKPETIRIELIGC
ncbi:hypothetical protein RclHR1_12410004 [Rhizophagus clarus]|uniref:Uncharacterized protein n=1 Tax=Rhizophagus clarus TaxID=94130 RepID=A0A2Z6QM69_9GLOM|nr:hypothetical protein RclHR1_12410004 [Rhizophagus clarus]